MKKGVLILIICILLLQVVYAETSFFEGDLGYRADFIMANLPEDVVQAVAEGGEILQISSGGYLLREGRYEGTIVCETCLESLKTHIKQKQDIDYTEEEIIILSNEINQQTYPDLSNNQVRYLIENFETECNLPIPLLGGFAGGRFRNLTSPLVLWITIIILIFFIIIGILIIRALRKRGYGGRKKRKKKIKEREIDKSLKQNNLNKKEEKEGK